AGKFTLVVADTLKMQLELLRDGYSNALTGQRPFEMGEKSMDILLGIKKGEKVPEIVYTGLDLVTKDNVAQLLKYRLRSASAASRHIPRKRRILRRLAQYAIGSFVDAMPMNGPRWLHADRVPP